MGYERKTSPEWVRVRERWIKESKKSDDVLQCALCLRPIFVTIYRRPHPLALEIDHIVPHALGGEDVWENSQPAHAYENQSKGKGYTGNYLKTSRQWFRP